MNLDDSFFNAVSFQKDGLSYLELQYQTEDPEVIYKDADEIFSELELRSLADIGVSPCPEGKDYLAISLFGEFNAQAYSG